MKWSRFAMAAGMLAVGLAFLGPLGTIADPRIAAPAAVGTAALVAMAVVLGSEAALAVAVVALGVGYAFGGVRGVGGAAWAAVLGVIAVAGARVCFDARNPARIAVGAQRAVLSAQLAAIAGVVITAFAVVTIREFEVGQVWIAVGIAAAATPLFALRFVNRSAATRRVVPSRPFALIGGVVLVAAVLVAIVAGSVARDQVTPTTDDSSRGPGGEQIETVERAPEAPVLPEVVEEPAPTSERLVAIVSTALVMLALALLASNWFKEQPLEFKPAEATPGDGGGFATDSSIDDPDAVRLGSQQAAEVVTDVLRTIEDVEDPRRAVRLAYSMVETGFGDAMAPRHSAESEQEYLARILPALGVSAASMQRLTELFTIARFSGHRIDDGMRADAVAALSAVRDELSGDEPQLGVESS